MNNNQGWFIRILSVLLIATIIIILVILPRAYDKRWQFWGDEIPQRVPTTEDIPTEEPEKEAEPTAVPTKESVVEILPPDVKLILTFSDGDIYTYLPELWTMDFGDVWGIQMTGEGFEEINILKSTAKIIIPDGYYAILNVDGMGNYHGNAVIDGKTVDFDKGNPTLVGDSVIIPPNTSISIPFAGNDSSGALLVLSEDINLLQEYINNK